MNTSRKPNDFSLNSLFVHELKLDITQAERQYISRELKLIARQTGLPIPIKKYDRFAASRYSTAYDSSLRQAAVDLLKSRRYVKKSCV